MAQTLKLPRGSSLFESTGNHWAKDYIYACYSAGVVGGYSDSTFRQKNTTTRAEASKMVAGMLKE